MSLSRGNIQEANEHLKQLHQKVFELENQIQMQAMHIDELQKTNFELHRKLQETASEKESETTSELKKRLQDSEEQVVKLLSAAQERDVAMVRLEEKSRLFYEAVEHKGALVKIVEVLEELSRDSTVENVSKNSEQ
ncbi:uncharacterized protein LOC135335205 [Halichondria panicea]|uniref:uncharacterized protein LOC135335205 n=1 Tax=Halichondria panicea TaxID=6063 RepID=UPI00312B6340